MLQGLLKALYSHPVALTALPSLLLSGGLFHLLLQLLDHLRTLLLQFQMIRCPNTSLDEDMDEVQFAGAVSTSDPHNFKQAMQADDSERLERRLH